MNKIKLNLLLAISFCIVSTGCATSNDIVIYGAGKTDNYPKQLKNWEVAACVNREDCQRLTDPLANCQVSANKIECANKHIYHCDANASWHIIDHGYHKAYLCTNQKPIETPERVPDSNF